MNRITLVSSIHCNRLWCYFVVIVLNLVLISSCAKQDDQRDSIKDGPIKLMINVKGFNADNGIMKQASTKLNELDIEGGVILDRKTYNGSSKEGRLEIDFISSVEDINSMSGEPSIKSFSNLQKMAAVVQEDMTTGVTYCFMIYKYNSGVVGDLVDVRLGEVGSPMETWVNDTDSFIWYAYSFNSSDSISLPDRNNPVITTSTTSPLLYAQGTLSQANIAALGGDLPILFNQKLSKVEVEIDTRSLFADMVNVTANFVGTPISTGVFNVKSGTISNITPVDVGNINMRNTNVGSSRLKENITNYYTATSLTSISVKFTEFTILHPNRAGVDLTPQLPNGGTAVFSGFTTNADGTGKLLKATLRPYLILPTKKFLTLGTKAWAGDAKGFAANSGTLSGNFLRSSYNIGLSSNFIRMANPVFVDYFSDQLTTSTTLQSILSTQEPDIVIASLMYNEITETDLDALEHFVLSGGVLFLLTETIDSKIQSMFREMMAEPDLTLKEHSEYAGIYKLKDIDPNVTNGIFGDVRGAYWGQDGTGSQYMENISNLSKLVVYTNGSVDYAPQNGVTMFRHTQRSLFFVGDTGFLAGLSNDNSWEYNPYQVVNESVYFPKNKPNYGAAASESTALEFGKSRGSWSVSNSLIFGNALAWLIERAHFFGRNLNGSSVQDEFIQTKENTWNFNRN